MDDDDEEEDMDALIEELESQDAADDLEEEETTQPGGARNVSEDLLQTDARIGLRDDEVARRRKKFGLNQMKEEKENQILKFLGFFVGPIQFVMEVSTTFGITSLFVLGWEVVLTYIMTVGCGCSGSRSPRLGRLRCHLRLATAQRYCWFRPRIPGRQYRCRIEEDPSFESDHPS